jgi:hypothetical protein
MLTAMQAGSLSAALSFLVVGVVGAACSVVNAPDDIKAGHGGAPSASTTSNPSGGSGGSGGDGGSGGSSATCSVDDDCLSANRCANLAHCDNGVCVSAGPVVVDDGDACTVDSCDPTTGEVSHEPALLDDGDACTVDSCDAATGVQHQPIAGLDDGNACTVDQCDPSTDPPTLTHTKILGCGCAHSACTEGGPLDVQGCSWARSAEGTCVETVCAKLPACCTESWGAPCVDAVRALCGQDPGGGAGGGSSEEGIDCGCAHSYCVKGAALAASCDPCVAEVCAKKPACCDAAQGGWTSDCVIATNTLCNAPPAPNCQ